eukprot:4087682-Pyramimonas_sp.AAC.1
MLGDMVHDNGRDLVRHPLNDQLDGSRLLPDEAVRWGCVSIPLLDDPLWFSSIVQPEICEGDNPCDDVGRLTDGTPNRPLERHLHGSLAVRHVHADAKHNARTLVQPWQCFLQGGLVLNEHGTYAQECTHAS